MSATRNLALTLLITACTSAFASKAALEGCPDPAVVTSALKNLRDKDWHAISPAGLRSMWPTELRGSDCDQAACQTLIREERVINGECECCELFNFDIHRDSHGAVTEEELYGITIHYSALSRGDVLEAARMFALAMGLSEAETKTVGGKPRQSFYWTVRQVEPQSIALMDIEVFREHGQWKVFVSLRRHTELASGSQGK